MDFYRDPKRGPTRSTKQQIYDRYCQLQYRKDGKTRQFISEWLHCESGMRVYKRFDLVPPGLHCDPDSFNLWTAWPCESFEAGDDREQLVNLLASVLKHVKTLANHKKSNYDFVMKFFAQYVQFTHKKGGVMLILSGDEGCGKSTIMKLVKMMFGDHFLSTSKPRVSGFWLCTVLPVHVYSTVLCVLERELSKNRDRLVPCLPSPLARTR